MVTTTPNTCTPTGRQLEVNRVYQGNSLELIAQVESETVHLILSDIPYGIGSEDWDILHENTNSAYLGSRWYRVLKPVATPLLPS